MREGLRDLGRGTFGLVKWLVGNVLLLAAMFAGIVVLGFAFGVVSRIDRWIRQHDISPTLLIAATAYLTVQVARASREMADQPRPRRPFESDPDPPASKG